MKKLIFILFILFNTTTYSQSINYITDPNEWISVYLYNYNKFIIADKLTYPVNHGSMEGYHDAQPFGGKSSHLGADINGIEQGNSDMGDTIYSIGNGKIIGLYIADYSNTCSSYTINILHFTGTKYIVSQYRHCCEVFIEPDQYVKYLQPIARIGNECGLFLSHLHFEIRTDVTIGMGNGYGNLQGYTDPIKYIQNFNKKSPL